MTALDYSLCAAYLAFMVLMGAVFFRGQRSPREYFLAGRDVGWVAVGISLMATLASSIGFIGAPAAAQDSGVLLLWSLLAFPIVYPVVTRVFIPLFRGMNAYTAYEYLEKRFDLRVRLFASALFIFWRVTWMAVTLYVPALVLHVVSGETVPVYAGVIVLGVVTVAYTTLGGIRAVMWTDVAQFIVMFGGICAALVLTVGAVPGGIAGVWQTLLDGGKLRLTAAMPGWNEAGLLEKLRLYAYTDFTVLAIIVGFTLDKFGNYCADQVLVQRYLAARSLESATRGFLLNCFAFSIYFTLLTFVGLTLFAFRQHTALPPGLKPDSLFPYFIAHYLPPGGAGLLLSAIMAAAMSSLDSGVNSCIAAITNDFYHRLWRGHASLESAQDDPEANAARMRLARLSTAGLGVLVIALGCVVGHLGGVFELALKLINGFIGPLFGVFLLAVFTRRSRANCVFWGMLTGCLVTGVSILAEPLALGLAARGLDTSASIMRLFDIGFLWTSALGLLVTLAGGYTLSLVLPGKNHEPERHGP